MTRQEFDTWLSAYLAAFPDTQRWLSGVESPEKTLDCWYTVLKETDAVAAVEVTERMARGDLEPLPAYERERTAAFVRIEARKLSFAIQSAKQHVYSEPRVSCPICLDVGSVVVWAKRSVEYAREYGKAPSGRYVESVACTCNRGDGLAAEKVEKSYSWRPLPRYDEAFYCRTKNGTPSKADEETLLEWVEGVGASRHQEFDDWNAGVA